MPEITYHEQKKEILESKKRFVGVSYDSFDKPTMKDMGTQKDNERLERIRLIREEIEGQ